VVLMLAMIVLIFAGIRTSWLNSLRHQLNFITVPFYQLTDIPRRINEWSSAAFASPADLQAEIERLNIESLIHQRKLLQMAALAAENVRLRQLLNATDMLQDKVLIAELIGVSPNPLSHTVIINRGTNEGVYERQPVLDAFGLMGQIIEVNEDSSRVLLITDPIHAIPVQVNRNGVRAIAEGTGDLNRLNLRHVSINADIREGDLLVSSGLGDRFPIGYPVAEVEQVVRNSGQAFARVIARPMARLDRSRHVLLVFDSHGLTPTTPAEHSAVIEPEAQAVKREPVEKAPVEKAPVATVPAAPVHKP
jgi:rod shape-determining protein MreC